MKYIVGKKIEMSRIWKGDIVVPVTKVQVGPCRVVQVKTKDKDGYDAVQLGYGERKVKNIAQPQLKHMSGLGNFRWLREFRYDFEYNPGDKSEFDSLSRGDWIDATTFAVGDTVEVSGASKGRGFQGTVKRHRFHGHNTTHGTKDQVRMPGSIGAGEPQHVFKGTRMAGRMGGEQVTIKNLEIVEVNANDNTILIKGGLPGSRNSLVLILGKGSLLTSKEPVQPQIKEPEVKDEQVAPVSVAAISEKPAEVKTEPAEAPAPAAPVEAKAEVKAEEAPAVKAETPATDAEKPEPAKVKEKAAADTYVEKFKHLPKEEREKLSSPEVMKAISDLESAYDADLISVVAKLAVKEVTEDSLTDYILKQYRFDEAKAKQLTDDLKEKILKLINPVK